MRAWLIGMVGVWSLIGPAPISAQEYVIPAGPRQLTLTIASENDWRGHLLSGGATVLSSASVPLIGHPVSVKRWNGLLLGLEAWNPLSHGPATEQYAASLRLRLHPSRLGGDGTQFGAVYRVLYRPDAEAVGTEAGVSGALEVVSAAYGLSGVYVVGEVLRGFGEIEGTFVRGGLEGEFSSVVFQWIQGSAVILTSVSDYSEGAHEPDFGHHATVLGGTLRFPHAFNVGPQASVVPGVGARLNLRNSDLGKVSGQVHAELRVRW